MRNRKNIQPSTFNTERSRLGTFPITWVLKVECWALNVFRLNGNCGGAHE